MRAIAGLLLTISAIAVAAQSHAQPTRLSPAQRALLDDVFAHRAAKTPQQIQTFAAAPFAMRGTSRSTLATGAVFALPPVTGSSLDQTHLLNTERLIEGQGLAVWRTQEVSFPARGGAVDTLRVSLGGVAHAPGGVVTARPDALMAPDARAFEVSFTRGWPAAWSLTAGRYALDVSPHAGVGFSETGGSAEAGALVRLGRDLQDRVTTRLGFRTGDAQAEDGRGGWFLFAAASGRAVGVNMAPSAEGGLPRPGWSSEPATTLVSDAQAGLGWRRGALQASVGYVHRDVKNQTVITSSAGPANYHDSMVAISFTITPR
jgi:hypothetical protein